MSDLIISISGVRGISRVSLTKEIAFRFGLSFADYLIKKNNTNKIIAIGRDPRDFGKELFLAISQGLAQKGFAIYDLGVVPTPTVQLFVIKEKLAGGIIITASHNPKQWNGLKFVGSNGIFLDETEANQLILNYEQEKTKMPDLDIKTDIKDFHKEAFNWHLEKIIANIDIEAIKAKNFKVAIDPANGAGSLITKSLLEKLNCQIFAINDEQKADFNRSPEPIAKNIKALTELVLKNNADIGFAQDADADRLAIIDEKGMPIGEDLTLVFALEHMIQKYLKNPQLFQDISKLAVTNLSTTTAFDKIAEKYSFEVLKTKIGEVNVSYALKEHKALIGGEGNGGVIMPKIGFGRDSLIGIALILEYLAMTVKKVSELKNAVPAYFTVKDKIECADKKDQELTMQKVASLKIDNIKEINSLDGYKFIFENGFLHIRTSNTEPIIRIIAEAKTEAIAKEMIEKTKETIK